MNLSAQQNLKCFQFLPLTPLVRHGNGLLPQDYMSLLFVRSQILNEINLYQSFQKLINNLKGKHKGNHNHRNVFSCVM